MPDPASAPAGNAGLYNLDPDKANTIATMFGGQDKSNDQTGAMQRRMQQASSQ